MPTNQNSAVFEVKEGRTLHDVIAPSAQSRRMVLARATACSAAVLLGPTGLACASDRPSDADGVGTVWWVELIAASDVKSAAYYDAAVGWSSKRVSILDSEKVAQPDEPAYTLFMSNGNEVAGAYRADPKDPVKNRPMWIVYFQVDNVDKAIARAITKGGRLLIAPYDVAGSARMALLADIDATPFGVASPL